MNPIKEYVYYQKAFYMFSPEEQPRAQIKSAIMTCKTPSGVFFGEALDCTRLSIYDEIPNDEDEKGDDTDYDFIRVQYHLPSRWRLEKIQSCNQHTRRSHHIYKLTQCLFFQQ
ncbi:hypothetical protein U1Q18_048076 [Sarracenia purpurea var. burkii]